MMALSLAKKSWYLYDKSHVHPSERQASRVQTLHFLTGVSLKPSSDMQFALYTSVYLTVR